jgi:predicted phosphodiesterase
MCLIILVLIASGCKDDPMFQHTIAEKNKPWTDENFDNNTFTFAVFSDLTGGERPGIFDVAVAQLNLLRPELILCVGDLIEGDHQNLEELNQQWDVFDSRSTKAKAPVFYVGGNHDLSGKDMQDTWEERYGRRYYHFIYKNVLFLILDTEDNTPERVQEIATARRQAIEILEKEGEEAFAKTAYGQMPERNYGNIGQEQASYFKKVISEHPEVRQTFLFMHKAPWKFEADQNHFEQIETALKGTDYTLFHGHEHAYAYEKRDGNDYIQLATTGGVQLPEKGRSADQVVLVTVEEERVDIANILLAGILDKSGHIPIGGDSLCFEKALCKPHFPVLVE